MKYTVNITRELYRVPGLFLLIISCIVARPNTYNDYHNVKNAIISVKSPERKIHNFEPESSASEVRDLLVDGKSGTANIGGFLDTYGSDADGTKGYVKETFGKGDRGYKNSGTFHKQDGDNYAFQKYTLYGQGRNGKKKGHHNKKKSQLAKQIDHEGSGTSVESQYTADDNSYLGDGGDYYSEDGEENYEGDGESDSSNYGDSGTYYSSGEGSNESKQYSGESDSEYNGSY